MDRKKRSTSKPRRRVAVVTGTRAEFGLLVPVMDAIRKRKDLELLVVAAGAHFLKPARTIREVEAKYTVAARVPMQTQGRTGRATDAAALGRGVEGFARAFRKLKPDWVVVLGDRIEAFAAASAASIAGIAVCHIHGGDRAEGIADESMRHAITKLSHLHCAATQLSAERIRKMGEKVEHVYVAGSPAIDGLSKIKPMSDAEARRLGDPSVVVLLHPSGLPPAEDAHWPTTAFALASVLGAFKHNTSEREGGRFAILLNPNNDPGNDWIRERWRHFQQMYGNRIVEHLPREAFLRLLCRLSARGGVLVGNSSAGLIEAAALKVRVINLGPRQNGRERAGLVVDMPDHSDEVARHVKQAYSALRENRWSVNWKPHPYGDGRAGPRIAALLAKTDPHAPTLLRKRNSY